MPSVRHTARSLTRQRTDESLLLDAARECILAVGWRRTTLTDVARRAGVSRMTIYRIWPDMQTLLADLMTREWSLLAGTAALEAATRTTGPARVAGGGGYRSSSELARLQRDVLAGTYHPSDTESVHSTVATNLLGPLEYA